MLKISVYTYVRAIAHGKPARVKSPRREKARSLGDRALALTQYPIEDAGVDDNVFNDGTAPHRDYTLTVASACSA